ncbi:MAG TPA: histone deacetylase [Thermoguttaceae bacterium]|nr:histone deacetylase [Thermoguttaceae bacterium]
MTLLYNDPCFLQHETFHHPERADRVRLIPERLAEAGLDVRCGRPAWEPVRRRRLTAVHATRYVDEVWSLAKSGGGEIGSETVLSPCSYDVALLAAGCACDAAERVIRGEDRRALCLVRPPGHHAMTNCAMGFCVFNNVAIAAKMAVDEFRLDRVLVVDWDVHHGNGTQATFWEDPRVGFLSIHRWPFYPGTGSADETGGGPGIGTTLNLPVPAHITRRDYLAQFSDALETFAARMKPQLVLISAGFDTHRGDPIGQFVLETEDFATLTNRVLDVADTWAWGRVVSVLEGGYDGRLVADCVTAHLGEMVRRDEMTPRDEKTVRRDENTEPRP